MHSSSQEMRGGRVGAGEEKRGEGERDSFSKGPGVEAAKGQVWDLGTGNPDPAQLSVSSRLAPAAPSTCSLR